MTWRSRRPALLDRLARLAQAHARASLVEHVDGAVGQLVVAHVARGQLGRRLQRVVGELHVVVRLVARAQALENPDRLGDRRLVDGDLLQPPRQRAILLDVLELLVRRRADDAELACGEDRLDQRREIHRAAGGRSGADRGVDLVDEEDRHAALRERLDDRLEPLLEVAAEAGAGEQRRRVEREHLRAFEQLGHVLAQQPRREAFGQRGLADAGVADEHRIVLAAAAENFERALELVAPADQRIELAGARAGGQARGIRRQRIARRRRSGFAETGFGLAGAIRRHPAARRAAPC